MGGAFLHKKSLLDQFKDDYKMVDPIKARRTERQWENPIVRHKREKGVQDWAKSFAGKRHYRKLTRFNAMRSEAYTEKTAWTYLEELGKLEGEESRMDAAEKILKALGCKPGTEGRWYGKDGDEIDIIDVLDNTEWAFAQKVCGQLQEARQAKKICPKFVQINTQRDFDKYIKPALGKGADAYGLSDIEGMWWEIADGERVPASAKTMREIRDSISKRPRFIFISGAGAERGIADLSLTEYAEEMGMTVKEYLDGYDAGSWESKQNERSSEDYLQEIYDSLASAWDKSKFNLSKGYDPDYDYQCVRVSLKENPNFYSLTYVIEPGDANYVADRPASFQTVWRYPNDHGVGVGEELEFQSTDFDEFGKSVFDYFDELKEWSTRKTSFESKKSEDSLDDFDNRRRVSPSSKYITFSGLARGAVRDDVRRVLSKGGILDPQLDKPGDSVRFEFGVQNNLKSVRKALAALLELGERNTWYIKYSDGDSEHNRVTMYSPDIPNDMWYAGDVDKIVSYIMPAKSEAVDETLSYEKGNKNSRGEDAPWVIRDHKGGKILASFAKKADAEAHLERMQCYSKSESAVSSRAAAIKDAIADAARATGLANKIVMSATNMPKLFIDVYQGGIMGDGINWEVTGNLSVRRFDKQDVKRAWHVDSLEELEKSFESEFQQLKDGKFEGMGDWDLCILVARNPLAKDTYYCYDLDGEWTPHEDNAHIFKSREAAEKAVPKFAGRLQRGHLGGFAAWDPKHISIEPVATPKTLKKALHESRVKKLEKMGEAAKSYVLAHKGPNDTTYCKNKAGDWTTHIEDAWEGSGPDSFSAEMKRNFADSVHCDVEDLEVVSFEKFEAFDRPYRDDVILQILDQDNNTYSKEDLEGKTVAELEEIYSELINLADAAKHEAIEGVTPRDVQAAARSAWSASGAKDFKLDTEKLDDVVRIRAMGPKGEDNIGIWWVVSLPSLGVDQYAEWGAKPYEQEPERTYDAKDLDDLEDFFLDEFEALQETLDISKENI